MGDTVTFGYEIPVRDGVAKAVSGFLAGRDPDTQFGPLLDAAVGFVDHVAADMAKTQPPPQPLACRAGCSHCCTGAEVPVSPLEALNIAEHLLLTHPVDDVGEVLMRALDTQEAKEARASDEPALARFVCPLLVDDRCSVYEVRPLACRGINSYDAEDCRLSRLEGDASAVIMGYVHPMRIASSVHAGFRQGLGAIGLDATMLDLTPALLICLSDPEAKAEWLAGGDVFARAHARLIDE